MDLECAVEQCGRPRLAKSMCSVHYERARAGRPVGAPVRITGDDGARFWSKVTKGVEGCWVWAGGTNPGGYGIFVRRTPGTRLAHRIAYEWARGAIAPGISIDHACHNRACVNPAHLRLATHALNNQNLSGPRRGSRSGVRGVRWHAKSKKWQARANLNGRQHSLGHFDSIEDAEAAAVAWRRDHMPYSVMDQEEIAS